MNFDDAVKKSIKVFLNGKMPMKTGELNDEGLFFTPEYFDTLEEELLEEPTKGKKKKKDANDKGATDAA
jgi:hypothetical protein|tara:strand:- start:1243 stop:1449 length:207 start_codon:yes stop_codon:yes gene_type:complete